MRGGNRFAFSNRPLNFPLFNRTKSTISSESSFLLNDDDFLPWLRQKSGQEISSSLSIGWSSYGRSLFSSRCIHAGECILSVPFTAQLTPEIIPSFLKPLIREDVSAIGRLAIVLLAEMRTGQCSDWAPYISRLPGFDDINCLIFWSEEELEMIQCSQIYHEAYAQQTSIEKEYLALKPILDQNVEYFGHVSLKSFMHAYAIGCWITGMGKLEGLIFDFLNHDGKSENVLMSDEDAETSEVISARDYAAGEQVLIRYGKFANATLLLDFGFTIIENKYDQVQVSIDIPQDDPLYKVKWELLKQYCRPRQENGSSLEPDFLTFTIKEVKLVHENGRGIPPSLRAFVRVLSANSHHELEEMCAEASENDGRLARRPLKSRTREIKAHRILLSQISSMIQRYELSLQCLSTARGGSKRPCRVDMARDLLAGELRVLESASSWLRNYCSD